MFCYGSGSIARIAMIITRTGSWYGDETLCKEDGVIVGCYGPYNKDILDSTEHVAYIALISLIFLQAAGCLAALKWRWLGSYIIYLEILVHTSSQFFPNSKNYHSSYYNYLIENFVIAGSGYCGQIITIYMQVILLIF